MYLNSKTHYLSHCLLITAMLNIAYMGLTAVFRFLFGDNTSVPDNINPLIYHSQLIMELITIALIFIIFYRAMKDLKSKIALIESDDYDNIASLQKEFMSDKLSTLRGESILQLLEIWGTILVVVQIMSIVANYQYKKLETILYDLIIIFLNGSPTYYNEVYNSSHGFKYICMFTALMLGISITGIFLNDKYIKLAFYVLVVFFLVSFVALEMITFYTSLKIISIVWTSVITHGLETIGLIILAIYLKNHYRGL